MKLIYKFKKEKLENGLFVSRPRIIIKLHGPKQSIFVPALIDSGSDRSVIPKSLANDLGLSLKGDRNKLYAYSESTDVIEAKATMTFYGKSRRIYTQLSRIPILISLNEELEEENEIVLGIDGIFDMFNITFNKMQDKIIFKKNQFPNFVSV